MLRQTSILSYSIVKKYEDLGKKHRTIIDALSALGKASDRRIRDYIMQTTGEWWELGLISARRNELMRDGYIREAGEVYDNKTKRMVTLWTI